MSSWILDVKLAARHLRKSWAFTAAAVLTLAVGVGANATLFSLADSVMFRPFPFPEQERLVIGGENQTPIRARQGS